MNTTTKPNAVQEAINAAKQQAQERANAAPQTIDMAAVQNPQTGMVTYQAPRIKTVDDLGVAGFDVDNFLTPNEFGLTVKDSPLFTQIKVSIDTSEKGLQVFEGIRYGSGNNVTYEKTYDGVNSAKGGSWAEMLKKAQVIDPQVRPYNGADITMTVLEDVVVNNVVAVKAGTRIGRSTAPTEKANLQSLITILKDTGRLGEVVNVLVTNEVKKKPGRTWGVLKFTLI